MVDITVFTPVYNRIDTIERVYNSLRQQTFRNFEWVVVDDGSTDGSFDKIIYLSKDEHDFKITFYQNSHGGKHRAVNKGLELAKGRLFFMLDSDDWLTPNALEIVISWEKRIPQGKKCSGLCGCMGYPEGGLVSKGLSKEYIFKPLTQMIKEGITGDHADILYTDVFRKYPYPEIYGEYHIAPGVPFIRMANDGYSLLFFNEVIYIADYRLDGLTAMGDTKIINNFKGYTLRSVELLSSDVGLKRKAQILLKYSLICIKMGISVNEQRKNLKINTTLILAARSLAALALALKIRK